MAYDIGTSSPSHFSRDGRVLPYLDAVLEAPRASDAFFQQPAGPIMPPLSGCEMSSPEGSYQWNLQARILKEDLMRVHGRKLNIITRSDAFYGRTVDDLVEEDHGINENSPRLYEDAGYFSSQPSSSRLYATPIHQRGSSPTSVLENSGDSAWNLLCDVAGRIQQLDLNNRSSYLMPQQTGSPRNMPLCPNSPFVPPNNPFSRSAREFLPSDNLIFDRSPHVIMPSLAPDWAPNGYGFANHGPLQNRKLNPSNMQERGFQRPVAYPANPRPPMRGAFVGDRNGQMRESSGTGVFLPRCVGGPNFNRKPSSWGEDGGYSSRKYPDNGSGFANQRQPNQPPRSVYSDSNRVERSGVNSEPVQKGRSVEFDVKNLETSDRSLNSQLHDAQGIADSVEEGLASECDEKLELPSEWVY